MKKNNEYFKKNLIIYQKSKRVMILLEGMYPNARCELNYNNAFELLIATILSAQSTDKKVNQITSNLFKKYNNPQSFLELTNEELEEKIKYIGLQKNKSKNILATCKVLIKQFDGQVPKERKELESLPGVGRKTANVVMSNAFDIPAFAVDTHVFRVANRIGLTNSDKVLDTEKQLMKLIPPVLWFNVHHWLIWHGRKICSARNPQCNKCILLPLCDFGKK